ncbi:MAG: PadR family transcriptional regulator [Phycisphaerales bacterium]|jgi:PadR family transcriptional regulator PadR|nr:PadR family transcriptional regulator [Phycisphaeraceae bacterium]
MPPTVTSSTNANSTSRAQGSAGEGRTSQPELLQGTLDVMILSVLNRSASHGYGIAREIERLSGKLLTIEEGSLYPALSRLSKRGDLSSEWQISATGRRAKVYRLTPTGRSRLRDQAALWDRLAKAVSRVVGASERVAVPRYEGAE